MYIVYTGKRARNHISVSLRRTTGSYTIFWNVARLQGAADRLVSFDSSLVQSKVVEWCRATSLSKTFDGGISWKLVFAWPRCLLRMGDWGFVMAMIECVYISNNSVRGNAPWLLHHLRLPSFMLTKRPFVICCYSNECILFAYTTKHLILQNKTA
jgi:hypothetical protein